MAPIVLGSLLRGSIGNRRIATPRAPIAINDHAPIDPYSLDLREVIRESLLPSDASVDNKFLKAIRPAPNRITRTLYAAKRRSSTSLFGAPATISSLTAWLM